METALVALVDDLNLHADQGHAFLLILLAVSEDFDTDSMKDASVV